MKAHILNIALLQFSAEVYVEKKLNTLCSYKTYSSHYTGFVICYIYLW
jgi:hypothetical protein